MHDRDLGTRDVWERKKRERERRLVNPGRGGAESMKRLYRYEDRPGAKTEGRCYMRGMGCGR